MGDAFFPYGPLDTLKPFGSGVWIVDGHEVRMRSFGLPNPFPTRMTVAWLPDGGVWIHSPVAADEMLYGRGEALGAVAHLVAPNTLHRSYVADWRRRFPGATVHIVLGLEAKVAARRVIADAVTPWSAAIDWLLVQGSALTEAASIGTAAR